jgi:hypothetical protein
MTQHVLHSHVCVVSHTCFNLNGISDQAIGAGRPSCCATKSAPTNVQPATDSIGRLQGSRGGRDTCGTAIRSRPATKFISCASCFSLPTIASHHLGAKDCARVFHSVVLNSHFEYFTMNPALNLRISVLTPFVVLLMQLRG